MPSTDARHRQQRLIGYITAEKLAELVMIQSSRSAWAERAATA